MQDITFFWQTLLKILPILNLQKYFKFCDENFSVKTRKRKARNTTPCCTRSPGHTTPSVAQPEPAGALFRDINCFWNYQCVLHTKWAIYMPVSQYCINLIFIEHLWTFGLSSCHYNHITSRTRRSQQLLIKLSPTSFTKENLTIFFF